MYLPLAVVDGGPAQDDTNSLQRFVGIGNCQSLRVGGPAHKEHNDILWSGEEKEERGKACTLN